MAAEDICAAENGVWLLYAQDESYSAELYAYSGELLASVELDEYRADLEYPFVGGLAADAEHVYFDCLSVVFIFDNTGPIPAPCRLRTGPLSWASPRQRGRRCCC